MSATNALPSALWEDRDLSSSFDSTALAPGLLFILRQAVVLRAGLLCIGVLLYALASPGRLIWLALGMVAESLVVLALVLWPIARARLKRSFLLVVLAWLLISPMVERVVALLIFEPDILFADSRVVLEGAGIATVWLVIPVVLATWQYGRQGFRWSMGVLITAHLLMGLLSGSTFQALGSYVLNAGSRLVMMGIVGYVVLRLVAAQQAEHRALQAAHRQLAQRAATVEQLAESRERNRLARELHDTLAHSLTGLSVQLQALGTLLSYDPLAVNAQLKQAQATVRNGIQEARRAIGALRAAPLEELGLSEALRQLCRGQAERTGVQCQADIAHVEALDPLTEQAVYRVAEAALANVEQHAGALHVQVVLRGPGPGGPLRLEVTDDGVGFDPRATPAGRFGLSGMAERAALIGAALRVESRPGAGTRIVLEV
jgi:signal transduction histidine kinase